jgi:hypothetical protein
VIPVQDFMSRTLAEILRKAPASPEKTAFAWRSAVGSAVANVTTVEIKGHTLVVHARDEAWRREIERSAGTIRARLNALLGDQAIRSIDVIV